MGISIIDGNGATNQATVKPPNTAVTTADTPLVVALHPDGTPSPVPDTVGVTAALNALNAVASVALAGQNSAGMQLIAGTLIGTLIPEVSYDGGTTWEATEFEDPTTATLTTTLVFGAPNGAVAKTIIVFGGVSNVRVRVSAFTSGTANCTLRATAAGDRAAVARLTDGTNIVAVKAASTASAATDPSLVVAPSPNSVGPIRITTPNQLAAATPIYAQCTTAGTLRVTEEQNDIFNDPMTGTVIDTTNRWTSGGTAPPTLANSVFTFPTTGAANSTSWLISKPTFSTPSFSGLIFVGSITLEAVLKTHTYRFWGWASQPGSPTAAAPITDGIGFEVTTAGIINAVIWASGSRVFTSRVDNLPQYFAGANNLYVVTVYGSAVYWYINGGEVPVVTSAGITPNQFSLSAVLQSLNDTTGPGTAPTFTSTGVGIANSANQAVMFADGTLPYLKATVKAGSTAAVATDTSIVVTTSPNSAVPTAGTSTEINVAQSSTSVTIAAANPGRKGLTVTNTSTTSTLYLFEGATAFVGRGIKVPPGITTNLVSPCPSSIITGIWDAAGSAHAIGFDNN